ncbi:zinc-finger of a c2HC-type domain-containing protein [Ditylenchus destructor]|nr:zinc-finger of a c2HC-type domain-containing protein [Ditylenchus destructor]
MEHLTPGPPQAKTRAPTVYCYICGRQYGSKSIAIHQPQCLEKWRIANNKLPKNQRRPEPVPPEIIRVGGKIDYEATNEAAYEASLSQLVRCENCGRKFAQERLSVHQKSCTKENPAAAIGDLKVRRNPPLATTMAVKARSKSSDRGNTVHQVGGRPNSQWKI